METRIFLSLRIELSNISLLNVWSSWQWTRFTTWYHHCRVVTNLCVLKWSLNYGYSSLIYCHSLFFPPASWLCYCSWAKWTSRQIPMTCINNNESGNKSKISHINKISCGLTLIKNFTSSTELLLLFSLKLKTSFKLR